MRHARILELIERSIMKWFKTINRRKSKGGYSANRKVSSSVIPPSSGSAVVSSSKPFTLGQRVTIISLGRELNFKVIDSSKDSDQGQRIVLETEDKTHS